MSAKCCEVLYGRRAGVIQIGDSKFYFELQNFQKYHAYLAVPITEKFKETNSTQFCSPLAPEKNKNNWLKIDCKLNLF
jgi:hypothetical protein